MGLDHCVGDVVVVGAGAAGLCAALCAAPRRVLLLAPDAPETSCTELAKGGIAAPLAAQDSVAMHVADTLRAGDHSVSEQVAGLIIGNAVDAIAFLERAGVVFDAAGAARDLHREAGHGLARILHADGDRTGSAIHRALLARARESAHIEFRDDASAVALLRGEQGVGGVLALREGGEPVALHAAETVLATGGLGQLFAATTNARSAAGDGLAMAIACGAQVAGLEFVQFHPTALRCALDPLPLMTEALRGAGAALLADGQHFMPGIDARGDLAPRDIVARAVWSRAEQGAQVVLDARAIFQSALGRAFPAARAASLAAGVDPAIAPIPVTCAAHFHMGGIVVDAQGRTSLPGLWAAGEVAYTGLHGANRLASNSLLEAVVIGNAVGFSVAAEPHRRRPVRVEAPNAAAPFDRSGREWLQMRRLMWRAMGPVRDAAGLEAALAELVALRDGLPEDQPVLRLRATLAAAMTRAALLRRESRGAHWRRDFAERNRARDGETALIAPAA